MAAAIYDSDAVDFSVDTSELEAGGKIDDTAAAAKAFSENAKKCGSSSMEAKIGIGEEEGECPSDAENNNYNGSSSSKTTLLERQQNAADLEEGECDEDDNDATTINRTTVSAQSTARYPINRNSENAVSDLRPFKPGVCAHYLKGTCTWGDNCRYFHPTNNETSAATNSGNYVLFEELESARKQKEPAKRLHGNKRGGGGNLPERNSTNNNSSAYNARVPVHKRLGGGGDSSAREQTTRHQQLQRSTSTSSSSPANGFVPMPFSLPKQETAWEAGLRKMSEVQSSAQKRRERLEDIQLGITTDNMDVTDSTTATPGTDDSTATAADKKTLTSLPNTVNQVLFPPAAIDPLATVRGGSDAELSATRNRPPPPIKEDLTITIITDRKSNGAGTNNNFVRNSAASNGGAEMNLNKTDQNSSVARTIGKNLPYVRAHVVDYRENASFDHGRRNSNVTNDAEFPPPPSRLLAAVNAVAASSSGTAMNTEQQRRYAERELSKLYPSRKYYMNIDAEPARNDRQQHNMTINARYSDAHDAVNHHDNRGAGGSFRHAATAHAPAPSPRFHHHLININEKEQFVALNAEESALEVARRRHRERQPNHHVTPIQPQHHSAPHAAGNNQQQRAAHSPPEQQRTPPVHQQRRKRREGSIHSGGNMSNISSSPGAHSLDVISDSEDNHHNNSKQPGSSNKTPTRSRSPTATTAAPKISTTRSGRNDDDVGDGVVDDLSNINVNITFFTDDNDDAANNIAAKTTNAGKLSRLVGERQGDTPTQNETVVEKVSKVRTHRDAGGRRNSVDDARRRQQRIDSPAADYDKPGAAAITKPVSSQKRVNLTSSATNIPPSRINNNNTTTIGESSIEKAQSKKRTHAPDADVVREDVAATSKVRDDQSSNNIARSKRARETVPTGQRGGVGRSAVPQPDKKHAPLKQKENLEYVRRAPVTTKTADVDITAPKPALSTKIRNASIKKQVPQAAAEFVTRTSSGDSQIQLTKEVITTKKATTASEQRSSSKRTPVKLVISSTKRIKSGSAFDSDADAAAAASAANDDAEMSDSTIVAATANSGGKADHDSTAGVAGALLQRENKRPLVVAGEQRREAFEAIGNSDDGEEESASSNDVKVKRSRLVAAAAAAASTKSNRIIKTSEQAAAVFPAQASPATTTTAMVNAQDRQELMRQLRMIEQEIAAKKCLRTTNSSDNSASAVG